MRGRLYPRSLFSTLFISYLTVIAVSLLLAGFLFSYLFEQYFFSAREWELTAKAENVADILGEIMESGETEEVENVGAALAKSLDIRIGILDKRQSRENNQPVKFAPAEDEVETWELALTDNEIEQVMRGSTISKKFYGPEPQRLLIALPVVVDTTPPAEHIQPEKKGEKVIGAIAVNAHLSGIQATLAHISNYTIYSGLITSILAGILALSLSKTISRPIQAMSQAARDLERGNFQTGANLQTGKSVKELGELSSTFQQAVSEVNRTMKEQKRLRSLQQNLVASVSHEFRIPLTSIQGFAEAMREGFLTEEEKDRYLQVIIENTSHLNRLVNDLMDLSALESGSINLEISRVTPEKLADRALQSIQPKAHHKGIALSSHIEKGLPAFLGDENRLYQVLVNLLENAVTYTPEGGRVALNVEKRDNSTVFQVSDTGIGIPAEDLPHIWDHFYKVDKSRSRAQKGKGLGLAIVRELVNLHGGSASVESSPQKGSTFTVVLPPIPPETP